MSSVNYYDRFESDISEVSCVRSKSLFTFERLEQIVESQDSDQLTRLVKAQDSVIETALVAVDGNRSIVIYHHRDSNKLEFFKEIPKHVTMLILAAS